MKINFPIIWKEVDASICEACEKSEEEFRKKNAMAKELIVIRTGSKRTESNY